MEKEKLRQLAIRRLEEIKENEERKVQIENIYYNFFSKQYVERCKNNWCDDGNFTRVSYGPPN